MTRLTQAFAAATLAALGLGFALVVAPKAPAPPSLDMGLRGSTAPIAPALPPSPLDDLLSAGELREDVIANSAATGATLVREEAGRISGIVVDALQAPVPDARVELLYGKEPAGLAGLVSRPRPEVRAFAHQATNASGGFSFEAPAGFWTLRVVATGMAPFEEEALRQGDFRWIELKPSADITVLAEDETGAPIPLADVRVIRGLFTDPEQAHVRCRTDANGEATLGDLPTGSWSVRASHGAYITRVVPLPEAPSRAPVLRIVMRRGITVEGRVTVGSQVVAAQNGSVRFDTIHGLATSHTVRCDPNGGYRSNLPFPRGSVVEISSTATGYGELREEVRLDAEPGTWILQHDVQLESLERTATGRVLSHDGTPLPGVEVYAHPLTSLPPIATVKIGGNDELRRAGAPDLTAFAPKASPQASRWHTATSDEQGYFRTRSLHPTRPYELLLVAPGHANRTLWLDTGEPGATFQFGPVDLDRPGRVTGFVRRKDGSGIEGAQVYAVESPTYSIIPNTEITTTRPSSLAAGLEAYTNASGYFSIEPFPRKPFRLMCQGVMYGPFEFDGDGELAELDLVAEDLHRRASERAIPVSLTITDTSGRPAPKAYVEVQRVQAASDAAPFNPLNHWEWTRGDALGKARTHVSSPGRYSVTVKDMEGLLDSSTLLIEVDGEEQELTVQLPVSAAPPGILEGTVLSHVGEPLAAMEVTLIPVAGTTSCGCMKFQSVTDAQGQFSFGHFMAGQHRVVVTDPSGKFAPGQLYPAVPGQPMTVRM